MLQFLEPIWLLAAGGIVIPVVIHLWNIRQGKILKVGSIQLLARTAQQRARSLQITEWLLLLLRCLLIVLLAFLLAKPYWKTNSQKGWVLMEEQDAAEAYAHFKPTVDSLLDAGYTFHLFEKGFTETELSTVLNKKRDTGLVDRSSYWQLIKQLDKTSLLGKPLYLFTGNRLNRFIGERPAVGISVRWKTFTHADSVQRFIANAYWGTNDSIILTIGESHPFSTSYHQQTIAADQPKQNDLVLNVNNGNLSVGYINSQPVPVDTATLRITIFANSFTNDARYLQAALQSIKQVKKKRMDISVIHSAAQLPVKQDWLFWLSDIPVPANNTAHSVFTYQSGKTVLLQSNMYISESGTDIQSELYQRIVYDKKNTENIWKDGTGSPLLTKESKDAKQFYHFYSHFDPSWNELTWSSSFPEWIYQLIETNPREKNDSNDRRIIDHAQINLPLLNTADINSTSVDIDNTNAKHIVWILLFIVFCIERFFSYRIKKETAYA